MIKQDLYRAILGGAALLLIAVLAAVYMARDMRGAPALIYAEVTPAPAAIVFVTPSGGKFHRDTCFSVRDSSLEELTREQARNDGYEPCKLCNP